MPQLSKVNGAVVSRSGLKSLSNKTKAKLAKNGKKNSKISSKKSQYNSSMIRKSKAHRFLPGRQRQERKGRKERSHSKKIQRMSHKKTHLSYSSKSNLKMSKGKEFSYIFDISYNKGQAKLLKEKRRKEIDLIFSELREHQRSAKERNKKIFERKISEVGLMKNGKLVCDYHKSDHKTNKGSICYCNDCREVHAHSDYSCVCECRCDGKRAKKDNEGLVGIETNPGPGLNFSKVELSKKYNLIPDTDCFKIKIGKNEKDLVSCLTFLAWSFCQRPFINYINEKILSKSEKDDLILTEEAKSMILNKSNLYAGAGLFFSQNWTKFIKSGTRSFLTFDMMNFQKMVDTVFPPAGPSMLHRNGETNIHSRKKLTSVSSNMVFFTAKRNEMSILIWGDVWREVLSMAHFQKLIGRELQDYLRVNFVSKDSDEEKESSEIMSSVGESIIGDLDNKIISHSLDIGTPLSVSLKMPNENLEWFNQIGKLFPSPSEGQIRANRINYVEKKIKLQGKQLDSILISDLADTRDYPQAPLVTPLKGFGFSKPIHENLLKKWSNNGIDYNELGLNLEEAKKIELSKEETEFNEDFLLNSFVKKIKTFESCIRIQVKGDGKCGFYSCLLICSILNPNIIIGPMFNPLPLALEKNRIFSLSYSKQMISVLSSAVKKAAMIVSETDLDLKNSDGSVKLEWWTISQCLSILRILGHEITVIGNSDSGPYSSFSDHLSEEISEDRVVLRFGTVHYDVGIIDKDLQNVFMTGPLFQFLTDISFVHGFILEIRHKDKDFSKKFL
jgi:hypothetical protein